MTKQVGNIEINLIDLSHVDEMSFSRSLAAAAAEGIEISIIFAVDIPGKGRAECLTASYGGKSITYLWVGNERRSQQRIVTPDQAEAQAQQLRQMGLIA